MTTDRQLLTIDPYAFRLNSQRFAIVVKLRTFFIYIHKFPFKKEIKEIRVQYFGSEFRRTTVYVLHIGLMSNVPE